MTQEKPTGHAGEPPAAPRSTPAPSAPAELPPASETTPAPNALPQPVSPPIAPVARVMPSPELAAPLGLAPPLPETEYPSRSTLARWLLVGLALYAVGWLLVNALPALTPFIIGLVLAYLLLPIVNRLARWMPRWLAILTVYVGAIVLIVIAVAYIAPLVADQIELLIVSFPGFIDRLQAMGQELFKQYQSSVPASIRAPIEEGVRNGLRVLQANITTYLQSVGTFLINQVLQIINTVTFVIGFLIIPIWLFYVLNDVQRGSAYIDRLLHRRIRSDFWNVWSIINGIFSDYIRGQLLLGVAVGLMVGVFLLILRLFGFQVGNYILLLSIIAGVTELIPIIGPIIGAIPGVIIGFTVSPATGLAVLLVYVAVQQLENNLLVPRIIGESVGIHAAILTVVLIAMGHIFGLLGVVLAAPISAIARDLFVYIYKRLEGNQPSEALAVVHGAPAPARAAG